MKVQQRRQRLANASAPTTATTILLYSATTTTAHPFAWIRVNILGLMHSEALTTSARSTHSTDAGGHVMSFVTCAGMAIGGAEPFANATR